MSHSLAGCLFDTGWALPDSAPTAPDPIRCQQLHAHIFHGEEHTGPAPHVLPAVCLVRGPT